MTESPFHNKRIVLGVTGSIACYKAANLASSLTQAGALVDVIITQSAARFITPLTFQSLTGRPVYTDMWDDREHVQHIELGEQADLLVIAPATAHTMAKLAHGMADNLLTVTTLAARCPIVVAPAMDGGMYEHPATQANEALLKQRGVIVVGPADGRMASGLVGTGRLVKTDHLIGIIRQQIGRNGILKGKRVLVTAGATQEPLDPVRYLTNRSSGRQGISIAQAAIDEGANVTLLTGNVTVPIPSGCRSISVRTAQQLHDVVLDELSQQDILIMTAAVADFRPESISTRKIKKDPTTTNAPTLPLVRNPDILQAVNNISHDLFVVGFAAETDNIIDYGIDKLTRKGLDLIVVNDVSCANSGFAVETNAITIISPMGIVAELPIQHKDTIAKQLINHINQQLTANA